MEVQVQNFHNLTGLCTSEYKKNFNLYTKQLKDLVEGNLTEILANIKPRNHQEEIFYLKLLITFKDFPKIEATLLRGYPILNKIIINEAFEYFTRITPKHFVEEISPNISYSTRIKIINKLPYKLNESQAETYYRLILEKYGLTNARPFLIACNLKLLCETVAEHQLKFSCRELLHLHKKFPDFLNFHFELHKNTRFQFMDKLMQRLALHDARRFEEVRKYPIAFRIGRKALANYLKEFKAEIIERPSAYRSLLIPRVVCKVLKEDFSRFFKNLLPARKENLRFIHHYLKLVPRNNRGDLLHKAFLECYGCDVDVPKKMLEMLTLEDRLNFNTADYLYLQDPESAFSRIKSNLSLTTDGNARVIWAKQLIDACWVNQDLNYLKQAVEYFVKNHRNDNVFVRAAFMERLVNFPLHKLDTETLDKIAQLIFVHDSDQLPNRSQILEEVIHHKILCKQDYSFEFRMFIKINFASGAVNVLKKYPALERRCLLQTPDIFETGFTFTYTKLDLTCVFLNTLIDWNRRHKGDYISLFGYPEKLDYILQPESNRSFIALNLIVKELIIHESSLMGFDTYLENYIRCVIEQTDYAYDHGLIKLQTYIFNWITHNRPSLIVKYHEDLAYRKFIKPLFYEIIKMQHLQLPGVLDAFLKINLYEQTSPIYKRTTALEFLSFTGDFPSVIARSFKVTKHVINMKKRFEIETFKVQKGILRCFRNYFTPADCLLTILGYAHGDYLKFVLQPLYYVCGNIPEKILPQPTDTLLQRSVSVRKHALCIAANFSSRNHIGAVLKLIKGDTSNSMQKHVFAFWFKFAVNNPPGDFVEQLADYLTLITFHNEECLKFLLDFRKIAKTHLPNYVSTIWIYVKSIKPKQEFQILKVIDLSTISKLNDDFCDYILKESIFNSDSLDYIYNYLISSSEIKRRTQTFLNCLSNNPESNALLKALCHKLVTCNCLNVIEALQENMQHPTVFTKVLMDFTTFCINIDRNNKSEAMANFIIEYQEGLIAQYGPEISHWYCDYLKQFLHVAFYSTGAHDENCLQLIEDILKIKATSQVKILALALLPKIVPQKGEVFDKHKEILKAIRKDCQPIVEVFLDKYLGNY